MMVKGECSGNSTRLGYQPVEIAIMITPDGHSGLELSHFFASLTIADHRHNPVNSLGYLRVLFRVDNLDELLIRLEKFGAKVVDEVVPFGETNGLCCIRGVEGLLMELAEQLSRTTATDMIKNN